MSAIEIMVESEGAYEIPVKKSVYCDFDGVIHSYTSGWLGANVIPDPPIEGAIEFLNELAGHYTVVIFTTRAAHEGAAEAIMAWLREYGFRGECEITHEKGPAIFYLDDRGWRFKGRFPTMDQIRRAHPWRVGDPVDPFKKKNEKRRIEIARLESMLGRRKAELRQLKQAAQAVLDYYSVEGPLPEVLEPLPEVLSNLRSFLK